MENREIDFIAKRYEANRFDADKALTRMGFNREPWWRKYRVAAAVAVAVVLSASAALIYNWDSTPKAPAEAEAVGNAAPAAKLVKLIDFEEAPLTAVVEKIGEVYGVRVSGLPENPEAYRLSLHYEGTADDLVATINEILGTELKVEKE